MISTALPNIDNYTNEPSALVDNAVVYARTTDNYKYPAHKTPYLLVANFISKGKYLHNGKHIEISDRYFYFLNKNDELEIKYDQANPLETLLIQFEEKFIDESLKVILGSDEKLLEDPDGRETQNWHIPAVPFKLTMSMRHLMNTLVKHEASTNEDFDTFLFNILSQFQMLNEATADHLNRLKVIKKTTQQELYSRLFLAREYMNDNLSNPLRLDQIAAEIGMNKFHFLSNFQKLFRTTPHQYLIRLKLERARDMLLTQQHTVSQTCFALGFESIGSFSNLFMKRYMKRPSAFLK